MSKLKLPRRAALAPRADRALVGLARQNLQSWFGTETAALSAPLEWETVLEHKAGLKAWRGGGKTSH